MSNSALPYVKLLLNFWPIYAEIRIYNIFFIMQQVHSSYKINEN